MKIFRTSRRKQFIFRLSPLLIHSRYSNFNPLFMRDIQIGCNVQLPQQHDTSQTNFFLNYFRGSSGRLPAEARYWMIKIDLVVGVWFGKHHRGNSSWKEIRRIKEDQHCALCSSYFQISFFFFFVLFYYGLSFSPLFFTTQRNKQTKKSSPDLHNSRSVSYGTTISDGPASDSFYPKVS